MINKFIMQDEFRRANLDDRALMLWKYADFIVATRDEHLTWTLYSMRGISVELTYSIHRERIEAIEIINDIAAMEKYLVEISLENLLKR